LLEGQRLVIFHRDRSHAAALRERLEQRGARAILAAIDEPPERALASALQTLGGLDAAVVWPSALCRATPIADMALDSWNEQLTLPLRSTILVTREVVDHWLGEGESGQILFVHHDGPAAAQQALDTGLHAFARSVAKEYGRRQIRTNLIIETAAQSGPCAVHSIATVVGLLLTSAGSFVNGQRLMCEKRP
jgi:NAD(P)-dependent dehydrogenase (short-subunit alcohol dehydrogenase family)